MSLLALLPCFVVVVAVLVLRLSGLIAASLALGCAVLIWLFAPFAPADLDQLDRALRDAVVLELLVGAVVFTGLMFVDSSTRSGAPAAIRAVIDALSLPTARAVILITTRIGVMVESLTGYGVSMLVTIPLLLLSVGRLQAITLALIGMSLMPWGALSVSALLGAELAGISVDTLSDAVLLTSGAVAVLLPVLCVLVVQGWRTTELPFALLAGCVLVACIALTSRGFGVEVAGVGGGLGVMLMCALCGTRAPGFFSLLARRELWAFGLLLGALALQKVLIALLGATVTQITVETARVSFAPLASPALALLVASMMTVGLGSTGGSPLRDLLARVCVRGWRALLSIFIFLVTARLLLEVGAIAALGDHLSQLGLHAAITTVTALGGLGAYVTGSGVTANALFMPSAAVIGSHFELTAVFAALQHSAAGHAAMASLPVIAVLVAALPDGHKPDEAYALRRGLQLALGWLLLVALSGFVQVSL